MQQVAVWLADEVDKISSRPRVGAFLMLLLAKIDKSVLDALAHREIHVGHQSHQPSTTFSLI